MNSINILVVDDEIEICNLIKSALKKQGYAVTVRNNAIDISKEELNKFDLILLDVMMPTVDGFTLCRYIRDEVDCPIIFITAKTMEEDILEGFSIGADDYITKPFSVRELMARVKANLRKAEIQVQSTDAIEEPKKESILIEVGELSINIEKFEVKVRGKVIDLTLREFEVLKYLANQPGQVVTRETLLEKVWGYEYYGDIRTVDVTVRRIREKIEKDTSAPKILITKRGVGYYLATN